MATNRISYLSILTFIALLGFSSAPGFSQDNRRDVVYLKSGIVLSGTILEHNDNGILRMRAVDGRLILIPLNEIQLIAKEGDPGPTPQVVVIPEQPTTLADPVLLVGASIPVGVFGNTDGDYAGFAKTGYVIAFEYQHIGVNSIYFAPGISYTANQLDQTAFRQVLGIPAGLRMTTTPWTILFPTISFGYGRSHGVLRYYLAGIIGYAICESPRISLTYGSVEVKQDKDMGRKLGLGVVFGLKTTFKLNFSIRYLYVKPHYDLTSTSPTVITLSSFDQPTQLMQAFIAIGF